MIRFMQSQSRNRDSGGLASRILNLCTRLRYPRICVDGLGKNHEKPQARRFGLGHLLNRNQALSEI
jgi:hypothetical protein